MYKIENSTEQFIKAVEQGKSIVFRPNGTWDTRWRLTVLLRRILRPIFRWNDTLTTARNVSFYLLNGAGKISGTAGIQPGTWEGKTLERLVTTVKKSIELQKKREETGRLKRTLKKFHTVLSRTDLVEQTKRLSRPSSMGARAVCAQLDRAYLSHHYLGIPQQQIARTNPKEEDITWIRDELLKWQTHQFPSADFFTEKERAGTESKIRRCSQFPKFIEACRENSALLELFFSATFYNLPADCDEGVDFFIQAPRIQKELQRLYIDKRIREVANTGLQVVDTAIDLHTKDFRLLIDGEYQSIANPSEQVRIAKDITKSVKEVFKTFKEHDYGIANLEYLQNGVTLFDSQLPDFDLSTRDWWKKLPIVQKVTRKELEVLYGTSFKEGEALLVLRASRTTPDLNANGSHSWMDIAVPLEDGTFNLLSVGKFAHTFPRTLLSTFLFVFKSHKATITIVDPNKFMSSRERISAPLTPLSKDQFDTLMATLAHDITRAREGRLVFQALGDNCATWILGVVKEICPNLDIKPFWIPYQDLVIPRIVMPIIHLQNSLPKGLQKLYRFAVSCLFGAASKLKVPLDNGKYKKVRLIDNEGWKKGHEIPGQLFFTIEDTMTKIRAAAISVPPS